MYKEIIEGKKGDLENAIEHYKNEAEKIRTGRANPGIVEGLLVDYYGSKTPLKQMANISSPEPRLIVISPWDVDSLTNIEAAIKLSDLGFNPSNDGKIIRINIPPLTEERRRDFVKALNQKTEDARISVRGIREEIWQEIQEAEKSGKMAEDDKFRGKERLQEIIDEYNKKLEDLREKKEKDIMTV
ncbi:MAG: ribosome recycling factor [Candidatus Moranbacteria bacterium]|jgi:ribosome recycling factor|nr:ribosome recycling factor [Candidatus Moranbacteria bacterium]